ncbi:MAG: hypothetical protein NC452_16950 [Eubacterium sp.]|nr:hypothetical protein [Eubacterium sp.]
MTLNKNQRLICAGQMPLRAPDGKQIAAVPVYKIVPAESAGADCAESLSENERLVLVGTEQSKAAAEERYNALMAGEMPPKSNATPLYIKDTADSTNPATGLTEGEKRTLNPLVGDMLCAFSAAMREKETLKRQKKGTGRK